MARMSSDDPRAHIGSGKALWDPQDTFWMLYMQGEAEEFNY